MIDFYPSAKQMLVTEDRVFPNALVSVPSSDLSVVIHKTACNAPCTATSVARFFATGSAEASTHFIIDVDGTMVQCVSLADGAGGNCCLEVGHDTYWDRLKMKYGNLNLCTISIEHVDVTDDNSTAPTMAQTQASFNLVLWLCQQFSIPSSQIKTHASLDPLTRARCPGNYPMNSLIAFIRSKEVNSNQQTSIRDHWHSFFSTMSQIAQRMVTMPPDTTGIYNAWQSLYFNGKQLGPATSYEYDSIDWNGTPIKCQDFGSCRIEYYLSSGVWHAYGPQGAIA
jgi:N-acetyl-anhydromuramyl-L-alanine amidase AmpD